MAKDDQGSALSRITFVFETKCDADCTLYFMAVRESIRTYNVTS